MSGSMGGTESGMRLSQHKGELVRDYINRVAVNSMCVEPLLVPEQGAQQQGNLPMLIGDQYRSRPEI
jgi:hypothetical protein